MNVVKVLEKYKLRLERKKLKLRSIRRGRRDLSAVQGRTEDINKSDIILISTLRNERKRLPFFWTITESLVFRIF